MDRVRISWGIRTHRKREWKLVAMIASILAQGIDPEDFEILICGDTDFTFLDGEMAKYVRLLSDPDSAHSGRTSVMMNRVAAEARHPWICISDDDMIYCDGWYEKVCRFLADRPDVDLCSFPLRNVDGSRFWDWAIHENGRSALIDPRSQDPRLYVTGGLILMRRAVWEAEKWDEARGFYQGEDVEWSQRVIRAGFNVALCAAAYAVHNDWHYFQYGRGVKRWQDVGEAMAGAERPQANAVFGQYMTESNRTIDGLKQFVSALRWQILPSLDPADKGKIAELIQLLGEMEGELGRLGEAGRQLGDLAV